MEIISHALWIGAAYRFANFSKKIKKKLNIKKFNVWLAAFFGAFPDLISFGLMFVFILFGMLFGGINLSELRHDESANQGHIADKYPLLNLTGILYTVTHSAVIFFIALLVGFLFTRRILWEMFGWLLHILMDIPTHPFGQYPTPFLWPISGFMVDGVSWATIKFMAIDIVLLVIVYTVLYFLQKNKTKKKKN